MDAVWLVAVALLWGATNPFLKRGGEGIEKIKKDGMIRQFLSEVFFLGSNWKVCFLSIYQYCNLHALQGPPDFKGKIHAMSVQCVLG